MVTSIDLETPIEIVKIQEERIQITSIQLKMYIEVPGNNVKALLSFNNNDTFSKEITLWEGEEYTAIGQWKDSDVVNRLSEIFNINN